MPFTVEFPDFDPATMPVLPPEFVDKSWRNDACPSFIHEELGLQIFVDFEKAEDREHPETPRFTMHQLVKYDGEWVFPSFEGVENAMIATDDLEEVLAIVEIVKSQRSFENASHLGG